MPVSECRIVRNIVSREVFCLVVDPRTHGDGKWDDAQVRAVWGHVGVEEERCAVRIPSVPRSDQSGNGRVGAPVSHASDLFIFHPHDSLPPFQLSMLAHCLLLKHRCKIPANESHLFPPSQPPASPLLHFIFYTFSCPSGATTPRIPTPLLHCSLLISSLDLLVGTQNVYKLPPFKDGKTIRLLRINLVVFSLPSRMLSCLV